MNEPVKYQIHHSDGSGREEAKSIWDIMEFVPDGAIEYSEDESATLTNKSGQKFIVKLNYEPSSTEFRFSACSSN